MSGSASSLFTRHLPSCLDPAEAAIAGQHTLPGLAHRFKAFMPTGERLPRMLYRYCLASLLQLENVPRFCRLRLLLKSHLLKHLLHTGFRFETDFLMRSSVQCHQCSYNFCMPCVHGLNTPHTHVLMQTIHAAVAANLPVFVFHPAERCAQQPFLPVC